MQSSRAAGEPFMMGARKRGSDVLEIMGIPPFIQEYLMRQPPDDGRAFVVGSRDGIDQAVVIPALAEKEALFEALLRLAANPPADLARTLVVCVINNRREGIADPHDIENNRETIERLRLLIHGDGCVEGGSDRVSSESGAPSTPSGDIIAVQNRQIRSSGIRLAYIDASSQGMEMPDKEGGVGLARKLGLDRVLGLFDDRRPTRKLLFNLDADAWVEPQYLPAVRRFFEQRKRHAGVVGYAHRLEADPALQAAICCYELFLRYYVLGLRFAGSPYAFHTIGSTMICTPEIYAAVQGMNRREAAEDFYFLNKIAKSVPVEEIRTTTVHPSARPSHRVPFGTGRSMIRFLEGTRDEYLLYDPEVFRILKRWLALMARDGGQAVPGILAAAARIHPLLESFLRGRRFQEAWTRIQKNHPDPEALSRAFHVWFDGFKTLKLIHDLTEKAFPRVDMFVALGEMFNMAGVPCPVAISERTRSNLRDQMQILNAFKPIRQQEEERPA